MAKIAIFLNYLRQCHDCFPFDISVTFKLLPKQIVHNFYRDCQFVFNNNMDCKLDFWPILLFLFPYKTVETYKFRY